MTSFPGGAGIARFTVAAPTNATVKSDSILFMRIPDKHILFDIISRGVQHWTSIDFQVNIIFHINVVVIFEFLKQNKKNACVETMGNYAD